MDQAQAVYNKTKYRWVSQWTSESIQLYDLVIFSNPHRYWCTLNFKIHENLLIRLEVGLATFKTVFQLSFLFG